MKTLLLMLGIAFAVFLGCTSEDPTHPECATARVGSEPVACARLRAEKILDELDAVKKILNQRKCTPCPKPDPDEVCDGWCEEARGAAKEYRRKFEAMCNMAQGMCIELQKEGRWQDVDCDSSLCDFFGDETLVKAKRRK